MRRVLVSLKAIDKQLQKFSSKDVKRLKAVFCQFQISPYGGDIEKMKGERDV